MRFRSRQNPPVTTEAGRVVLSGERDAWEPGRPGVFWPQQMALALCQQSSSSSRVPKMCSCNQGRPVTVEINHHECGACTDQEWLPQDPGGQGCTAQVSAGPGPLWVLWGWFFLLLPASGGPGNWRFGVTSVSLHLPSPCCLCGHHVSSASLISTRTGASEPSSQAWLNSHPRILGPTCKVFILHLQVTFIGSRD